MPIDEEIINPPSLEEQSSFQKSKFKEIWISLFSLTILTIGLLTTILLTQQKQEIRQFAAVKKTTDKNKPINSEKTLAGTDKGGKPEPAISEKSFSIGANIRHIVHYGVCESYPSIGDCWRATQDPTPRTLKSDIEEDLKELQRMGAKVIRVFAASNAVTHEENAKRLDEFLTKAEKYGIFVIPSLIDFNASGYKNFPKGTEQYYTYRNNWPNFCCLVLNKEFIKEGYKKDYLEYVKTVVSYNKRHKNIYAWEPGNELQFNEGELSDEFINFMNEVSSTIKRLDPAHPVSTGFSSVTLEWKNGKATTPQDIYPRLKNFDIITVHQYSGERRGALDVDWAIKNKKKAIVGEFGFSGSKDRSASIAAELKYWKEKRVSAILQWGFMSKNINQVVTYTDGSKDARVNDYSSSTGMDSLPRDVLGFGHDFDYDSLFSTYKSFSNTEVCIQVITYAQDPLTGACRAFSTPCDVPQTWKKVASCKNFPLPQ